MLYRVHEGQTILWPDGSIRAEAGEVFESYEEASSPEAAAYASAVLQGQHRRCERLGDSYDGAVREVAAGPYREALERRGISFAVEAPKPKPSAKKKVAKKAEAVAHEPEAPEPEAAD
jgi:hypothetical protein